MLEQTLNTDQDLVAQIERYAYPLKGDGHDYDLIIEAAKKANFVLIGEASHGTTEFYRIRAEITRRLIEEQSFDAVVVATDWPNAYAVNRYVLGEDENATAESALANFNIFPTWIWCNKEVLNFIQWLHDYNTSSHTNDNKRFNPVGFYGLDVYSMNTSTHIPIDYLEKVDPKAANRAKKHYGCLDHFMDNPQVFGYALEPGLPEPHAPKIIEKLLEYCNKTVQNLSSNGLKEEELFFFKKANDGLLKDAEEYYRSVFKGRPNAWNIRDQHMFETLENLAKYIKKKKGRDARIVVWAHNSHVGDASTTAMKTKGEFNLGELVRKSHRDKTLIIGFSTCTGTVTTASLWNSQPEIKAINEPVPDSYEYLFHKTNYKDFILDLGIANAHI